MSTNTQAILFSLVLAFGMLLGMSGKKSAPEKLLGYHEAVKIQTLVNIAHEEILAKK